jgi:hypothetical protein
MNLVFASCNKEDAIYLLTVCEIAQAQKLDSSLEKLKDKYSTQLVENTVGLCNDEKMVIPVALQYCAVSRYHCYLQHPGHARLEETLQASMYWKGMRNAIRKFVKNCNKCQLIKGRSKSMGNSLLRFSLQTLGNYYVWIS